MVSRLSPIVVFSVVILRALSKLRISPKITEMSLEPGVEGLDGHILLSKEDTEFVYRESGPSVRRVLEAAVIARRCRREAKAMLAFGNSEADLDAFCRHPARWAAAAGVAMRGHEARAGSSRALETRPKQGRGREGSTVESSGAPEALPKQESGCKGSTDELSRAPDMPPKQKPGREGSTVESSRTWEMPPKQEPEKTLLLTIGPVTAASLFALAESLVWVKTGPLAMTCQPPATDPKPTPKLDPKPASLLVRGFYVQGSAGRGTSPGWRAPCRQSFPRGISRRIWMSLATTGSSTSWAWPGRPTLSSS